VSRITLPEGFPAARDPRITAPDGLPAAREPYTGPSAGGQFAALEVLGEIAAVQRSRSLADRARAAWPLLAVLAVQAVLSLRLVWSDTAFPDEALYLWAGHLEWAHWLHGDPLPAFPAFFSGAPVVYPPLGAAADAAGGLAGARLLSLVFMLAATVALHGVTRRLFSRRAAAFAAAVFAVLAPVEYLGAFATYDAMALMLLAAATWLGVRAAGAGTVARTALVIASSATLVLADAAKYAAALFTLPVILTVVFACWWRSGRRAGLEAAAIMTVTCSVLAGIALAAGGRSYWQGITTTTLTRLHGTSAPAFLLFVSAKWEGALAALAIIGAAALIVSSRRNRPLAALACVLATAPLLAPAEQARIETYTSLFKHVGYGAWFGAVLAGYCLAALPGAAARAKAAAALRVSIAAAVIIGIPGIGWAASHYGWPDTSRIMPVMREALTSTGGPVLADDRGNVLDYYLPGQMAGRQADGTFFFAYNDPVSRRHLTQGPAYAAAIRNRYFSVVFLEFWDSAPQDQIVAADIARYGGYRLAAVISYRATGQHGDAMIWVRQGGAR
jgi:hypothetical protein